MSDAPEVIDSRRIHRGWVGLRIDTLRYASGREGTIEVVEHQGGATLVPVDAERRLLFVRQYRHPAGKELLELPAGTLDGGETPEQCAARELQEETGYAAARIERLGGFYLAPGYDSEYQHVFLCTELSESRLEGDEDAIELVRLPLETALRRVATGDIEDAKTAAALLLYARKREERPDNLADLKDHVENPELVDNALGSWPSLHDAEVLSLKMHRNGDPTITLAIKAIPYDPSGNAKQSLISVLFTGIDNVELFDFNNQNAVFGIDVESTDDRKTLYIGAAYGLAGAFDFKSARVLSARPLDA